MPQNDAAMRASIRQTFALMSPEQRFAMGAGSAADSAKTMGATGLKFAREEQAMERLDIPEATRDSMRLGLKRPTERKPTAKEEAGQRLVAAGGATQAEIDSAAAGIRRPTEDKPSDKEAGIRGLAAAGLISPEKADSLRAGLKPPAGADEQDFAKAKSVYLAMYPTSPVWGGPKDEKAPSFLDFFHGAWQTIRTGKKPPEERSKTAGFVMGGEGLRKKQPAAKTDTSQTAKTKKTGTWEDYQ